MALPKGSDSTPKPPRALTSRQERKLVDYLDERFLQLTRNFKKRSEESSKLQTLPTYLEETRRILALVLQIPPIDPSTSLRVAYLLRLTGDALGSIPGYHIGSANDSRETLQDLADFLDDLDQAWVAVLKGQVWDPTLGEGVDIMFSTDAEMNTRADSSDPANGPSNSPSRPPTSSPPSQTDLTRLRSLLLSGEAALEEWMTNQRGKGGQSNTGDDMEDVSGMLDRMGLLEDFDSLFARTLEFLGAYGADVAQNFNPPLDSTM